MGNLFTAGLFRQMLRSATPVGLAAMGGLMTEHAGIMNIGMDGMILMGAFTAVAVSWLAGSAWPGGSHFGWNSGGPVLRPLRGEVPE